MSKHSDLIALIGISGTGKTTLGKQLAEKLNYTYVDLDDFYRKEKPKIRLSTGEIVRNWDTLKALDLEKFREHLRSTSGGIIVGGFALKDSVFEKSPRMTILLAPLSDKETQKDLSAFSESEIQEEVIQRTIKARQQAKGVSSRDELMVREVVYPYFLRMLKKVKIDHILPVYDRFGNRLPVLTLVSELVDAVEEY